MVPVRIEQLPVTDPNDLAGLSAALHEDIETWRPGTLAPGAHFVSFPSDTLLVVVQGTASLSNGVIAARLQVGQRAAFASGTGWHLRVAPGSDALRVRYRLTTSVSSGLERPGQGVWRAAERPTSLVGRFAPCPLKHLPPEVERALYVGANRGALFDALYTLPEGCLPTRALSMPEVLNLPGSIESLMPSGLEPTVPYRHPELQHADFELVTELASLGARQEELLLRTPAGILRWTPFEDGEPLLHALRPYQTWRYDEPLREGPVDVERVFESLFTAFFHPANEYPMCNLRPRPIPYRIERLSMQPPWVLSESFRERWGIRLTCPMARSVVEADHTAITYEGRDTEALVDRWRVFWRKGHEFIEQTFATSVFNATLLARTYVRSWD
jgi:hypothetical protein